ncbi:MAG: LmeA family phospholipid-binding protein [Armatimonadota bacterium]|nr:LmeA family phospholipid-binding protein [Armatimonadota bacterium]MDR7438388.1 LmeA family phospholipid-binding protein [Armatimonadota bacterium]MDR7563346.1 LmeA family phospholipid-binding protein [Armatimonadota bacterium]MDR7601232.1 LmeA family phospholipid-binding protein [Armatimonadota bacterium]
MPAAGSEGAVRAAFAELLGGPPVLYVETVPDLHEGMYARISLYAQRARIAGLRVDHLWVRLRGVSLDPAGLNRGSLRVLSQRDAALHALVGLRSIEEFLARNPEVEEVRLEYDRGLIAGRGIVQMRGIPVRVGMVVGFEAMGTPAIYVRVHALRVNGIPLPAAAVAEFERRINPLLDMTEWPVSVRIRSTRITPTHVVLTTLRHLTDPCDFCQVPP